MRCERSEIEVLEPECCHDAPQRPGQVFHLPCLDQGWLIEIEDLLVQLHPTMAGCNHVARPLRLHPEGHDNPEAVLRRLRMDGRKPLDPGSPPNMLKRRYLRTATTRQPATSGIVRTRGAASSDTDGE